MTSAVIGLEALNRELPNFQGLLNDSPGVVRMLILDPPEGAGPIRYPLSVCMSVCMYAYMYVTAAQP